MPPSILFSINIDIYSTDFQLSCHWACSLQGETRKIDELCTLVNPRDDHLHGFIDSNTVLQYLHPCFRLFHFRRGVSDAFVLDLSLRGYYYSLRLHIDFDVQYSNPESARIFDATCHILSLSFIVTYCTRRES